MTDLPTKEPYKDKRLNNKYKDKWLTEFLGTDSPFKFNGDPKTLPKKPMAMLIYYLYGSLAWTMQEIGDYTGMHKSTVHRWIHSEQFKDEKHSFAQQVETSFKNDLMIDLKRMSVLEAKGAADCSPFQLSIMQRNKVEVMKQFSGDTEMTINVVHSKMEESQSKIIDMDKDMIESEKRIVELKLLAEKSQDNSNESTNES